MLSTTKHSGRFVDILTDFGFKFYFGREENKTLLIQFLNSLFEGEKEIVDLHYLPAEHDEDSEEARRVIFDLHCLGADGEFFIVEMQQLYQKFFRDRTVFYTSRVISKQLPKGKKGNNYRLPEVYFIGILEFRLDADKKTANPRPTERSYLHDIALCDKDTHEVFYDKLGYKLISLPDFDKGPEELHTLNDQWLYVLKHLNRLEKIPDFLDKRIFGRIFDIGEIAKLTKEERMSYEGSLKYKWDAESVFDSAIQTGKQQGLEEGLEEGRKQGLKEGLEEGLKEGLKEGMEKERAKALAEKRESAVKMLQNGFDVQLIADIIGLPVEEIEKLK